MRSFFIAGSGTRSLVNKRLARLGTGIAQANGIPSTFADLGDYPLPIYDGDREAADGAPENALKLKALLRVHPASSLPRPSTTRRSPRC